MSTKIIIHATEGGVPTEAQGMAAVLEFLALIHEEGHAIDNIRQTSDGIYIISPHHLDRIGYDPKSGELLASGPMFDTTIPSREVGGWCSQSEACYEGCGCKCWVDRGWVPSEAPVVRDSNKVHCKLVEKDAD